MALKKKNLLNYPPYSPKGACFPGGDIAKFLHFQALQRYESDQILTKIHDYF